MLTLGSPPTVPTLSIVAPAYNERANVAPLVKALHSVLADIAWELIIVDDDSPDGTAAEVSTMARAGYPVRCLRRVGRRGLSSAVVEGILAATADIVVVMDADLQHDESVIPDMLRLLESSDVDLVVGTRHGEGGGFGDWSTKRRRMSDFATWCSTLVIGNPISDPMSGFFAIRRKAFDESVYNLSQQGYKILLDILSSSPTRLKVAEVPYVFRLRQEGESKLDVMILAEFVFLLVEKLSRGLIPPRFILFCIVGGIGLVFHLAILKAMWLLGFQFVPAQIIASYSAMTLNYVINNEITYRPQRLRGMNFLTGYIIFCLVCSIGGIANVGVADLVLAGANSWPLAGIAGALMGAVFNFGAATQLVWNDKRRKHRAVSAPPHAITTLVATRS